MMITCAYGSSGFAIPLGSDFHQTGGNGFNSQYGVTFTEQYGETYHHDSGTYYGGSWNSGETQYTESNSRSRSSRSSPAFTRSVKWNKGITTRVTVELIN